MIIDLLLKLERTYFSSSNIPYLLFMAHILICRKIVTATKISHVLNQMNMQCK